MKSKKLKKGDWVWVSDTSEELARKAPRFAGRIISVLSYRVQMEDGSICDWKYAVPAKKAKVKK